MISRDEALMANFAGRDSAEPVDERVIATTCVWHPDHPTVSVTMRIYAPGGWDGEVAFDEHSISIDGEIVPDDDIRRGWTKVGD